MNTALVGDLQRAKDRFNRLWEEADQETRDLFLSLEKKVTDFEVSPHSKEILLLGNKLNTETVAKILGKV